MRKTSLVSMLILSAAVPATVSVSSWGQANDRAGEKQVLVQITVNTAYDDSEASLQQIAAIINGLPQRRISFRKDDNLSSLILREYRVSTYKSDSPSYLPETFKLIEQAILEANRVTKPELLRPGTILVPELPPKALEKFNPSNALNNIPILSVVPLSSMVPKKNQGQSVSDFEFAGAPTVFSLGRPASQNHAISFMFTAANAKTVLRESALQNAIIHFFNYPITMTLGWIRNPAVDTPVDHLVLSDSQRQYVRDLLAANAQRDVLVFVLDTGWPDPTAYAASIQALNQLVHFAQQRFFGRNLARPSALKPFEEPTNPHCKYVERSLAEFRALDPTNRIKVIYVPLTKEQNAAPVLKDLLQTEYLRGLTNYSNKQVKPPKDLIKRSRETAENTIGQSYPEKWSGDEVLTDKSILDAILDLGNLYARENHTVIFVNESWTVVHDEYHVYYPDPLNGIVLAAAGNANLNVIASRLDFADRSTNHKDTLAVMNRRPGQADFPCSSSFLGINVAEEAMATAFDGEVLGSSICGTSFAAPRIAWILAADEAVRKAAIDPTTSWDVVLHVRLKKIRDPNASGFDKYLFDPIAFLRSSAP
jgi:hypothetical protein